MKKNVWWATGIILPIALLVSAFQPAPDGGDTGKLKLKYDEDGQSLLWEISGNGLEKPSFLYGTIHIQDKRVFQFDKQMLKAFEACEAYAMELKIDDIDLTSMATLSLMKDTTLDMLLSEEEMKELDDSLKSKTGMPAKLFNTMKPFFTYSQVSAATYPKDMKLPLDMHLDGMAKEQEKIRLGIEKFSDQMDAINTIPYKIQADLLMHSIRDTSGAAAMDEMIKMYTDGRIDEMLEMGDVGMFPEGYDPTFVKNFEESFIWSRNRRMADTIAEFCHKQTTFNAVGAAHLGGDKGVVALLKAKGYTVKPVLIKFKAPK